MYSAAAISSRVRRPVSSDILGLVVFVVLGLAAGGLGSIATAPNIPSWYASLAKPAFNPPNAVFPMVWTLLYLLMAVSGWLVWRTGFDGADATKRRTRALVPFAIQLILNIGWSFAFFSAHSPLAGLVVIVLSILAIAWTITAFFQISRAPAFLLVPYLAWVGFAALLNGAIFPLN
jgi:tryptophan-rich sensory protein